MVTSAEWILEQVRGEFFLKLDPNASREERSRADTEVPLAFSCLSRSVSFSIYSLSLLTRKISFSIRSLSFLTCSIAFPS